MRWDIAGTSTRDPSEYQRGGQYDKDDPEEMKADDQHRFGTAFQGERNQHAHRSGAGSQKAGSGIQQAELGEYETHRNPGAHQHHAGDDHRQGDFFQHGQQFRLKGGAHHDPDGAAGILKQVILEELAELERMPPSDLVRRRVEKFGNMGFWED